MLNLLNMKLRDRNLSQKLKYLSVWYEFVVPEFRRFITVVNCARCLS